MDNEGANQVINAGAAPLSSPGLFPDLMTEQELITFLRIPEVSTASNHSNVIKNLIRFRNLPRIRIGKKLLFPRSAVIEWIKSETIWN
jgi:predicted DNA-binding transcriptional regulator AlpA